MSARPRAAAAAVEDAHFTGPRWFNRDASWLEFNRRVLAQAADERNPLLERVKFIAIFTTNLDEFFMKRVALIMRQVHSGVELPSPDGLTPRQQLNMLRAMVTELESERTHIFRDQVLPALAARDVHLLEYEALAPAEQAWADEWYRANVFSALTPLAVDPGHRFPFISNLSHNIGALVEPPALTRKTVEAGMRSGFPDNLMFARVKVPPNIRRFVALPGDGERVRLLSIGDIIAHNLADLFPGVTIRETILFRVTRSAGIQRDELDAPSLLQSVEADLKARRFARAVRIEVNSGASRDLTHALIDKVSLTAQDLYTHSMDLYDSLFEIAEIDRPDIKETRWKGVAPRRLNGTGQERVNFFAAIRKQDILVHHPYDNFSESVEWFIAAAATDPDVLTIKQTLYRTSPDSPFIEHLIRAAESGKQVACLVELRARFDEGRNVRFARQLEKAGVHVAYGVLGLKTHCKTSLVVRKERNGLRCYGHIGTGNYNPKTAQLYTDVGLLTCDPGITADMVSLFNFLTGVAAAQTFEHLLVAPFNMRQRFMQLIEREIEHVRAGRGGRIIAKMNALEDLRVCERLYEASKAGVKITLIVRGFCCLRPGVPGLSENVNVVSIVGRFLEHSRIFYFGAGAPNPLDGEWYIGSADWMYRNLSNRVEAATPIRDREARRRLLRIFEVMLADRRHAWDLLPEGTYAARSPGESDAPDSPQRRGTFSCLMADAED